MHQVGLAWHALPSIAPLFSSIPAAMWVPLFIHPSLAGLIHPGLGLAGLASLNFIQPDAFHPSLGWPELSSSQMWHGMNFHPATCGAA